MGMSYLLTSPLASLEVSSFLPLASSDGQPTFGVFWALLEFCMDGIIRHIVYCVSAFTSSHSCFPSVLLFQCLGTWTGLPLNGIRWCSFPSVSSWMVKFIQKVRNLSKPLWRPPQPSIHGLLRQDGGSVVCMEASCFLGLWALVVGVSACVGVLTFKWGPYRDIHHGGTLRT